MKKIYNILIATLALIAFAPVVRSQSINDVIKDSGNNNANPVYPAETDTGVHNDATNKVAYSKNISQPFSDGTYWIKLETFATGSAATILTSTPADIILVLDSSSSMTYDYEGALDYRSRGVQSYTWQQMNNTEYYYLLDGEYYLVSRGPSQATNNVKYLTFTDKNGKPWYLHNYASGTNNNNITFEGDGLLEEPPTTGQTNQGRYCWRGELYELRSKSRLDALREAVGKFIDIIWQNDKDVTGVDGSFLGNRIAIVTYDNQAYKLSSSYSWVTDNNQYANWFDIGADGVRDNLKSAVNTMPTHNWTRPGLGMRAAINDLLDGNPASKRDEANLTVVMFTDGVPARQSGTGNTFENDVANQGIYYGYQLKHDYDAKLFTVGLLNINSTDENVIKGIHFLDLLSSNYPESYIDAATTNNSAWTVSGNTVTVQNIENGSESDKDPEGNYFQLDNGDLSSIFEAIAHQAGGSANQSLSASTSTVDIVSNSFILPEGVFEEGADINDYVKVFTAKLNRIENGEYIFDTEVLAPNSDDEYYALDDDGAPTGDPLDVDANIEVNLVGSNGIEVVGFDYSANFCGPIYKPGSTTEVDHYQGHKLILMIPIMMNPDAVGGPNVSTNADGSGIILDGSDTPLVPFESPNVSLPVNIYIKKSGLRHGESAKFKIERAQIPIPMDKELDPEDESLTYTYVSTVFVTQPDTAPDGADVTVKVKGLPANASQTVGYLYRITEEEWAWSYLRDAAPQYTVTSKVDNPFEFSNTKKDQIDIKVRHAESKANNVFKAAGASTEYDDSKDNGR